MRLMASPKVERDEEEEELVAALMEELSFRSKRVITRETYDQLLDLKTIHCCVTSYIHF